MQDKENTTDSSFANIRVHEEHTADSNSVNIVVSEENNEQDEAMLIAAQNGALNDDKYDNLLRTMDLFHDRQKSVEKDLKEMKYKNSKLIRMVKFGISTTRFDENFPIETEQEFKDFEENILNSKEQLNKLVSFLKKISPNWATYGCILLTNLSRNRQEQISALPL